MADKQITLAIFDFDGTLTEGHLWVGVARHHQEKRAHRRTLFLYLLQHMPYWLASKVKLISDEKNRSRWGEDLSVLFKGFSVDDAQKAFRWVVDNYFMPLMRDNMLKIMEEHRQKGHKVMILSGMFTDFLDIIKEKVGADYVVGTRLERVNNIYSGKIVQPLCFGENKARFLNDFVVKNNLQVDFDHSSAYADSIYDVPVFRLVGHPVATYPDRELYRMALIRKWDIIGHANGLTINHM